MSQELTKKELAEGWIDGCWRIDVRHKCECGPNPYTEKLKNMTTKHQESWEERFDEKFGKDGPDKNSDSIGRSAGCDDCSENIEIRAEHKRFISETLEAERERIEREVKKLKRTDETQMSHDHTYDEALSDILSLINPLDKVE